MDGEQKLSGELSGTGRERSVPFLSMRKFMADRASDIDRVWELIEEIPVAMVVTHEGQGQAMRARPLISMAQDPQTSSRQFES